MRTLLLTLTALVLAVPAGAQQRATADPDNKVEGGGKFPAGWSARVDRDQPADKVVFRSMAGGFHATMGPAAVFYNAKNARSGDYKVAARFVQTKAPAHPEAYGLVLGGKNLDKADQQYSYFLVRGNGQYFIATRKGAERTVVSNWTASDAITKQDEAGKAANVLGAEVKGNEVIFTVNGKEVARRPKSEILTDGVFGYRVNHNLDVHIDPVGSGT